MHLKTPPFATWYPILATVGVITILGKFGLQAAILVIGAGFLLSWGLKSLTKNSKRATKPATKPNQAKETKETKPNYWKNPVPMSAHEIERILDQEAEPAIRLKRHWPPNAPFTGLSHLGGAPALPKKLDWPINPKSGLRLHHLAQINLSEMPSIDGDGQLPKQGTLWFFADIDEEMDWDEGPGSPSSTVLYSPHDVAGNEPAQIPHNLPEVDHSEDSMTGYPWGFRGPKFSVYPKWPITGHKTHAWEIDRPLQKEITDPSQYYDAQHLNMAQEKERIVGPGVANDWKIRAMSKEVPETRKDANGKEFYYKRKVYTPDLWGGMFPYSARFAVAVLRQMQYNLTTTYNDLQRTMKTAPEPKETDITRAKIISEHQKQTAQFVLSLEPQKYDNPLSASEQSQFDALMRVCFNFEGPSSRGDDYVRDALVDFSAQAMSNPTIIENIPPKLCALVESTTLPSHNYTEHFLNGPKGAGSNPTAGEGIRIAQIDSDYALSFMFCDVGIIDFWIDADDLAAGNWDRAWAATAGG